MDKKQILALDSKKHVKIWLLHKLGMSRREIAEALGTNPGHVGNEIKSYMSNKEKREAAESLFSGEIPKTTSVKKEEPKKTEDKKESQSFGERMREARAKKAAENASKSPEDLEYEKLMRILKQTNSIPAKELFAEFGIRDEQEMYGTAKRGHIFDKEYSQFSERKNVIIALKTLHVLAKLMPIKTTVTQKLVSHEDQHRYENGEDTESEYGVSRRVELDLQIFDKKSGEKIGALGNDSVSLSINNKDFKEAINNVKVYFKDGSIPLKPTVNFSKILSDVNKKAEEKKEADKWKTEKVPVGQKVMAKQDFEIWRQKTLKDVFEWLKARGFKRSHHYFDKAKEESLILKEYVNKLINYPVFYGMEMGYDVDKSYYKDSASITWQITANKYATKNKFEKEWDEYRNEWRHADLNSWIADKFSKEINPILGTRYSSSGYAYDSSKIGFSVWNQKSSNGSRLGKGGILEGPKHGDGGIKAKSPNGPLEVEGGEIIINAAAAKEHCEELSKINQSAGGGVAFPCDHPALDGIQGPMNGKGAKVKPGTKYTVVWVDRNYKEFSKDFYNDPLGPPENGLEKAKKFEAKLNHDDKKSEYGLYRSVTIKITPEIRASYGGKIGAKNTGGVKWFKDKEGRDRFEIDDSDAVVNVNDIIRFSASSVKQNKTISLLLSDIITVWSGYINYPDLKNVKLVFIPNGDPDGALYTYWPDLDLIFVNSKYITHEITDKNSEREKGVRSGSVHGNDTGGAKGVSNNLSGKFAREIRKRLFHEIQHPIQKREGIEITPSDDDAIIYALKQKHGKLQMGDSEFIKWIDEYTGDKYKYIKSDFYKTIPSEYEALDVERRAFYTKEQRESIRPEIELKKAGYGTSIGAVAGMMGDGAQISPLVRDAVWYNSLDKEYKLRHTDYVNRPNTEWYEFIGTNGRGVAVEVKKMPQKWTVYNVSRGKGYFSTEDIKSGFSYYALQQYLNSKFPFLKIAGRGAEIQKDWNVVYFTVDSEGADQLLHENFKSHVDYHELPNGDVLYVMARRQYDMFFDLADSTSQEYGMAIEEVDEYGKPLTDKYGDKYLDEAKYGVKIPISKNPTNLVYLKSADLYFNNISGNLYKNINGEVDFFNPISIHSMEDSWFNTLSDYDLGTVQSYINSGLQKHSIYAKRGDGAKIAEGGEVFIWQNPRNNYFYIKNKKGQFLSTYPGYHFVDNMFGVVGLASKELAEDLLQKYVLSEGVDVEKEHTDLYNELSQRLEADGHKMPMSKDEFFRMIAAAHIKEREDYYPLLKKYVEHAPSLMDKPYYILTKEEVIACRDFIEMRGAAGMELTVKCHQRLKDLARYSVVKFNTLLSKLK